MGGESVDVGCPAHCSVSFVIFDVARPSAVRVRLVPLNLTVGSRGEERRMIFFRYEVLGMGGSRELATLAPDHRLLKRIVSCWARRLPSPLERSPLNSWSWA